MTARDNYRYFFTKIGLFVGFKILSIWRLLLDERVVYQNRIVKSGEPPDALEAMRRDAWNAVPRRPKCGRKGRPEAKNLESIKGRLEAL